MARDGFGNTNNAHTTFRVIDPADDTEPPLVNIATPAPDTTLTVPAAIVGTVRDTTLVRYTLAYSPHDEERFTIFATGNTEVTDRVLGTLDTSLLLNDLYDIRLTAEDIHGRVSATTVTYQVTGRLKIGHFSFTLQDLIHLLHTARETTLRCHHPPRWAYRDVRPGPGAIVSASGANPRDNHQL